MKNKITKKGDHGSVYMNKMNERRDRKTVAEVECQRERLIEVSAGSCMRRCALTKILVREFFTRRPLNSMEYYTVHTDRSKSILSKL